jgi:hypothetical protein
MELQVSNTQSVQIAPKKLTTQEAFALYESENTMNELTSEYFGFDSEDILSSYQSNPNIVSELEQELREEKNESKKTKILNELRKFKRALVFKGMRKETFADDKGGEKTMDVLCFVDMVTGINTTMAQAKIVVIFKKIIADVGNIEDVIGAAFWVEFKGRKKNKSNAYNSDNFGVSQIPMYNE